MRSNYLWVGVCAAVLAGAVGRTGFGAEAGEVPRYRFEAGQELTYHEDFSIKYWMGDRNSVWDTRLDVVVRVVRVNADGSYRLVFAMRDSSVKTSQGQKTEYKSKSTFCADVFPDGRQKPMDWTKFGMTPAALFPPLPRDEGEMNRGWTGVAQEYTYVCKPVGGDMKDGFTGEFSAPFMQTLQYTRRVKYALNPERGFVDKIEDTFKRDSAVKGEGGGTTRLVGLKTMPPDELKRFADESDRYFAAANAYNAEMKSAENGARDKVEEVAGKAAADLKVAVAALTDADLKADGEEHLRGHDAWVKDIVATLIDRSARIGKAAPDFETTDVDGKKVRLADLRGKVVVLDFWYRGCAWCVRVTPQMNQLAEDFVGKPVAVLGMSIDHDLADSLFVINQLGIKYPTLRAEGLAERFGVQGYPTLIVIDPQGIVRKIDAGFSPTIREDVGKEIRGLLGT